MSQNYSKEELEKLLNDISKSKPSLFKPQIIIGKNLEKKFEEKMKRAFLKDQNLK